jgi:hypothetical protein
LVYHIFAIIDVLYPSRYSIPVDVAECGTMAYTYLCCICICVQLLIAVPVSGVCIRTLQMWYVNVITDIQHFVFLCVESSLPNNAKYELFAIVVLMCETSIWDPGACIKHRWRVCCVFYRYSAINQTIEITCSLEYVWFK